MPEELRALASRLEALNERSPRQMQIDKMMEQELHHLEQRMRDAALQLERGDFWGRA